MGAISFMFSRFLTFGTFKGFSTDKCDMYFKAEDCVIHMHIYGSCGEDFYHQVFEVHSCNLGESFTMRASLKNISFKNNTLGILEKVIENVFIIDKEEYNKLYTEHNYFLGVARNERREKDEAVKNIEFKNNIEKLVNNKLVVPVTYSSVFTDLLQKTFNTYSHPTYSKNEHNGYSICRVDFDNNFIIKNRFPNHEDVLFAMKTYVSDIMGFLKETDNELVIEINNILKKAK